jgi:hypothetical protein
MGLIIEIPQKLFQLFLLLCELACCHYFIFPIFVYLLLNSLDEDAS